MSQALTALAAVALLVVSGYTAPAALRVRGRVPFAVAALLAVAADVVLVFLGLSLFDALTTPGILAGEAVVAAASTGAWLAAGRPPPPAGWRPSRRGTIEAAREHPAVALLAAIVGLSLALQLVVAIAVVPNNWDSMTYHLARAAYWLQQHSVGYIPGGHLRQNANPPNGEILQAWTLAVTGTDRLANPVQWTALLGIMATIFSGARMLGFRPASALFAALLFAAMPQPLMQATSTQNDLIVAFFIVAGTFFGIRAIRDASLADAALSLVAVALGLGTKGTVIFAAPGVLFLVGAAVWRYRPPRQFVIVVASSLTLVALSAGGLVYARNSDAIGELARASVPDGSVPKNLFTAFTEFADLPGISVALLNNAASRPANRIFPGQLSSSDYDFESAISEDTSSFGPTGWLLFLPVLLIAALARASPPPWRALALATLAYLLAFALIQNAGSYSGRLMISMVALGAPLMAVLAERAWLRSIAVGLALVGLLPALLLNQNKPILPAPGAVGIFARTTLEQRTTVWPDLAGVFAAVDGGVPADGSIGFVGSGNDWDYPLFGPGRARRVVPMLPEDVSYAAMRRAGVEAVLFANVGRPPSEFRGTRRIIPGFYLAPVGPQPE